MNASTWVAIYMPLFILIFIIIPQKLEREKLIVSHIKNRKGVIIMTNEVIKKYIGKRCKISTGSFGTNVEGEIINVNENWLEVETKKGKELINADFIQSIKVKQI
jgi:hypothetical protein